MAESTSNQARDELMSLVKGKAKEAAGAVTGNDSLAAEGQLQQAEARARKEASAQDAVANAEQATAQQQLAEQRQAAATARQAADVQAGIAKAEAEQDAAAHADAADAAAGRVKQAAHIVAEQQTVGRISDARDDAARAAQETHHKEEKARRDYDAAQASAGAAERAAERAREAAHRLDHDAGLA